MPTVSVAGISREVAETAAHSGAAPRDLMDPAPVAAAVEVPPAWDPGVVEGASEAAVAAGGADKRHVAQKTNGEY